MTSRLTTFFGLMIFTLLFSSCGVASEPILQSDLQFQKLYPEAEFDQSFTVTIEASDLEVSELEDLVTLRITNLSSTYLVIQLPEGLQIYAFQDGQWQKIRNDVTYLTIDGGFIVYPKEDAGFGDTPIIRSFPKLEGLQKGTTVRFVITAEKRLSSEKTDMQGELVVSFVDLVIE